LLTSLAEGQENGGDGQTEGGDQHDDADEENQLGTNGQMAHGGCSPLSNVR
jgi:hypothetical protein